MSDLAQRLFPVAQEQLTSDDYYTPAWLFERMGLTFDLDVCSPPGGVEWIPAARYFTQADDGLAQHWMGRVWMNPPFSDAGPWSDRFIEHRNGVALFVFSKGRWFTRLWESDAAVVAGPERIEFVGGNGDGFASRTVLAAFGDECVYAISRLGAVRMTAQQVSSAQADDREASEKDGSGAVTPAPSINLTCADEYNPLTVSP